MIWVVEQHVCRNLLHQHAVLKEHFWFTRWPLAGFRIYVFKWWCSLASKRHMDRQLNWYNTQGEEARSFSTLALGFLFPQSGAQLGLKLCLSQEWDATTDGLLATAGACGSWLWQHGKVACAEQMQKKCLSEQRESGREPNGSEL